MEDDEFFDEEQNSQEEDVIWSFYATIENYDYDNPKLSLEVQGECNGTNEKLDWYTTENQVELNKEIESLVIEKIEAQFKKHLSLYD